MGEPNNVIEARLKAIEAHQDAVAKRQTQLEEEQKKQAEAFSRTLDLFEDNNAAIMYLQKYAINFLLETIEQGWMLTHAMIKFAQFLNLPPSSSKLNQYIDAAFTLIASAFPVLRLSGLLDEIMKEAATTVTIAKGVGIKASVTDTILANLPKGHDHVDVLKKANDTRMKALAAIKNDGTDNAVDTLSKLDSSKGAIKSMIATANKAGAVFNQVADTIDAEFKSRLAAPGAAHKKSILQMTQKILIPHNFLKEDELDMLETRYLWEMIASYCRQKVTIVITSNVRAIEGRGIEGLNDTQLDTIFDLFGPSVPRGFYFPLPPAFERNMYLYMLGVKTETRYVRDVAR